MSVTQILRPAVHKKELPSQQIDPAYKKLRMQVFLGIFIGYAGYYLVRKNFSMVTNKRKNMMAIEPMAKGKIPMMIMVKAESTRPSERNTRALLLPETVPITNLLMP